MSIELKESGFREWHDHLDGIPSVGVETARLDECTAYYHDQGFRGLFGNPGFGFEQDNLDFLARTKNAKWLWFWDIGLKNIDAIYELSTNSNTLASIPNGLALISPASPCIADCDQSLDQSRINGLSESTSIRVSPLALQTQSQNL